MSLIYQLKTAVQHERGPRKSKLQGSKDHHGHHLHHHAHHPVHHHHGSQIGSLTSGGPQLSAGSMIPHSMAAASSFLAQQQVHHTNLAQAAAAHHQAAAASLHHSIAAAAAAKAAIVGGNKVLPPPPAPPPIITGHSAPPVPPPHPPFMFPFAAFAAARQQQQQQQGNALHTIHHPTALFSPAFQLALQPSSSTASTVGSSISVKPGSPKLSHEAFSPNTLAISADGKQSNISSPTSLHLPPISTSTPKIDSSLLTRNIGSVTNGSSPGLNSTLDNIKNINLEATATKNGTFDFTKHVTESHLSNNNNE